MGDTITFTRIQEQKFYKDLSEKLSVNNFSFQELTLENYLQYKDSIKETLSCLTTVGELSDKTFTAIIQQWIQNKHIYKPIIIVENESERVIAIGTLLIELKLIHDGGKVGHIEDIAVNDKYQGKGLGKILLEFLKNVGVLENCYKVILDCDEKNVEFYNKCGFKRCGVEMDYRP